MTTTVAPRKSLSKIRDETIFYPHQISGVRDLARRSSFLLADEMGLGKSLQALTVAAIDFERAWAKRVIIIAPASLKWNWEDEINLHSHFTSMVLDGSPKVREALLQEYIEKGIDILIVNYEQVVAHLDIFNKIAFDIAVYDEAHYLKSYKSKRAKACRLLRASRNFLLTGSPLLNQVNELWSLLHIIDPAGFPDYWRFVNRYAVFGGYKDKQIVGVKNQGELQERLDAVMLRRLKKDVLDLPEKQYLTMKVDLHPEQIKLYKQAVEEMKIDVGGGGTAMEIENAMVRFLRLKQICGTTACIEGHDDNSTKLDMVIEKGLEVTDNGKPVVMFTQFRKVQECLVNRLGEEAAVKKAGKPIFTLNGDTPKDQRSAIVKQWGESEQPAYLVAMLQVAGVGLNMTKANTGIFADKLFVPKLNEQAEDRFHRIGADKTQPVRIIDVIARNTIESRIESILRRKRKLFDTLVEDSSWKRMLYRSVLEEEEDE